jgi:hypothetical protein
MVAPAERRRLPNRRSCSTFDFESQGLKFTASFSCFPDGSIGELFIRNHKASSMAGINAADAAVLFSIARQFGAPLPVLQKALMRDSDGKASGPLACALDAISKLDGGGA